MILLTTQWLVIIISIIVFFVVILTLVGVLLYAKSKLTPSGEVTVSVNDKREIKTQPGSTVFATLSANSIYLPSACGGGGTCTQCKCQVTG